MLINQAELSRLCGVSRAAICKNAKKEKIVLDSDGKVDTDNPVNKSFITRHNGLSGQTIPIGHEIEQPKEKSQSKRPASSAIDKTIKSINTTQESSERKETVSYTEDYSKDEAEIIAKRALYEAKKVMADAELKNIQIDEKNGALADRELIEFALNELQNSIQSQFFDAAIKQSIDICAILGKQDHVIDVQDIIAIDNQRRIQDVKRICRKVIYGKYVRHEPEEDVIEHTKENPIN